MDCTKNKMWSVSFPILPASLEALQHLPEADLHEPWHTAALTVAALCVYPQNKNTSIEMLNYLKGPQPLSPYEIQFLADRLRGRDYLPASFFAGASPENEYIPTIPYTVVILENPASYMQQSEGYVQLFIQSGGADSPRPVKLRYKASSKQWFLWEQMLLSEIRPPETTDPWV